MKYIFCQSVKDEASPTVIRFRPLPDQSLPNDTPVHPTMNIRVPKDFAFLRDRGEGHFYAITAASLAIKPGGSKNISDYLAGDIAGAYLQVTDPQVLMCPMDCTPLEMGYTNPETGEPLYNVGNLPNDDVWKEWDIYKSTHDLSRASSEAVKRPQPVVSLKEQYDTSEKFTKAREELLKDGFFVTQDDWTMLLMNIHCKDNTLLTGPAGSGKTELIRRACEKLDIPCHVFDMGSMYDPVSELLGTPRPSSNGQFVFDYARFPQVIQTPCVVLLDELSRAQPSVNNILLPCLDSRRKLNVENAYSNGLREIPVHPDCVFIATANIGDQYTGTKELDRALVDRFDIMEMSYLSADEEMKVLRKVWGISSSDARNIVTAANTIRSMQSRGEIDVTVSTRETLRAAKLVSRGYPLSQALPKAILPLFPAENNSNDRQTVKAVFMKL